MTSDQAKVELIRSLYDAWRRGEFGIEVFAEDVEWSTPHPGGTAKGRDALLAFLRSYMGAWDEYVNELEDVRVLPDGRLLLHLKEVARGRTSGVDLTWSVAAIVEIENGLITRYEGMERDEAQRRVGPAE
ncbi:MAG: nuclear transport factor 2 family protein [Thermoleophilaceae bacterium]|nr:nuclear transport factor 2 family protein [Thermoleophilaceae bacterium]